MEVVGFSWEGLGGSWGALGRILGGLGRVLGGLGAYFGGRWRHLTPTWRRNAAKERHNLKIRFPPALFGCFLAPRGAPREPKWRPEGAKGPQNGAQEAPKLIKKRIRSETQNMQKTSEFRSKIDFWRPGGGAKGAKKRQKRASKKVKEGREAKLGSRGL